MMSQDDWERAIDRLMSLVSVSAGGGRLYTAISEYHGRPQNKALNLALTCGMCTKMIYVGVKNLRSDHLKKDATPPSVTCPHCQHDGDHNYEGVYT